MSRIPVNLIAFRQVVREFVGALFRRRTYDIFDNWYCLFGVLWGIPVPIVTVWITLRSRHLPATISNIIQVITSDPLNLFFLLHPVFFGIIFGAMGTVRYSKEQKIEELDRHKSSFLSMISHELRTPLATIQGYVSFLLTGKAGALSGVQKECLEVSGESADLLNRLIEDLLDLSRIENGEFKITLEAVDLAKLAGKAILSRQLSADNQGVTLGNNIPKGLPMVRADGERLLQVIINLFENAIKFNHKDGSVAITASAQSNGSVLICVSDTGIGIPRDKLDRVFDKFYQVDSSGKRKYGGCGLGLAISKSIVELHRGRMWIDSTVGVGSKFYLELPL